MLNRVGITDHDDLEYNIYEIHPLFNYVNVQRANTLL